AMIARPLEGGVGKDYVVLAIGGEVAKIAEGKGDAGLEIAGEARPQRDRALDHGGRRIEAERGASGAASRKLDRMFTGAAAEGGEFFGAIEGQAGVNHRDR